MVSLARICSVDVIVDKKLGYQIAWASQIGPFLLETDGY